MRKATDIGRTQKGGTRGVALILVMLAMLVLTVLSAGIVFTARSETLASNSFRMNTEADYLAKAGIQQTVNWFRSAHYARDPVSNYPGLAESQATTYYNVTPYPVPGGNPLYTANSEPVKCIGASPFCTAVNSPVQLCGYASKVSPQLDCTNSTNFPNINNTESTPRLVATAFSTDLVNIRVTGDAGDSGTFSVNAYLISYQTVIQGIMPTVRRVPVETWLITSKGIWTGSSGSNTILSTVEEQAVIQPIYLPNWGDALYAYCDVTMQGSGGDCVDAFNSALGQYGGGNSTALHSCDDTAAPNVISNGGSIGANGGVTLGSNITVAGNVVIGSNPSAGCPANPAGFNGTPSQVSGQVVNGSSLSPTPVPPSGPPFPPNLAASGPTYNGKGPFTVPNAPSGSPVAWPNMTPPSGSWPGTEPTLGSTPCMAGYTCNGTTSNPFLIGSISLNGNGAKMQIVGGPDIFHPVVYDIGSISDGSKGEIDVSGYVVLNLPACSGSCSNFSVTGNGITNGVTGTVDIPPAAVSINDACSGSCFSIGGNGAVSALINAPNATVSLGGGGNGGYFVGAIQANNITDMGHYPIHYDVQLGGRNLGGTVSVPVVTAYNRKKM